MKNNFINRKSHRGRNFPPVYAIITRGDIIIEIIMGILLLAFWGMTLWLHQIAPDTIPTHFNAVGEAARWGNKNSLFGLAIGLTVVVVLLFLSTRFSSHFFNYPVAVNKHNIRIQHQIAVRTMRYLSLVFILIFTSLEILSVESILNLPEKLPMGLFILSNTGLIVVLIVFMVRAWMHR